MINLIKILAISIVIMCCIIAAYTDFKRQIIPNELTFSTIIIGLLLVTLYYFLIREFNLLYYLSVLTVFLISYVLWYLGVWAGGDVKLFTAISTLFIPEFLDVIPEYTIFNIVLPYELSSSYVPTLLLMFNSVLSIVPIILVTVISIIIFDKRYLFEKLIKTFDFNEVFLSLNSLVMGYIIISQLNIHYPIISLVFLVIISYIFSRVMKKDLLLIIFSIIVLIQQVLSNSLLLYLEELFILTSIIIIKNIFNEGIIYEALSNKINKNDLKEGMILSYSLYIKDNHYYFYKNTFLNKIKDILVKKDNGMLVCSSMAGGLTKENILKIQEIDEINDLQIKKGLSFAPFILVGLFITLFLGNTYGLFMFLLELL